MCRLAGSMSSTELAARNQRLEPDLWLLERSRRRNPLAVGHNHAGSRDRDPIPFEAVLAAAELIPTEIVHERDPTARRCESQIRVIDPEQQAMLRARREHPIRLETPLGRQVVDHRSDVARLAAEHERWLLRRSQGGIDPRKQALSRGLFITGRSVDLASQK